MVGSPARLSLKRRQGYLTGFNGLVSMSFSETPTYVEFWCPPDFCRYAIHGLSAELVSDRKSYDITFKTNDAPYYVLSKLKGIPTVSEL